MGSDPDPALLAFGPFELDVRSGELRTGQTRTILQQQPFRILLRLLERPGELVTREELRRELWSDDTFVDFEHSLNAAIKRLREALGDSAEAPRFIETLPRRGYRLVAPVPQGGATGRAGMPATLRRNRRWRVAGTAAAVLAALGAAMVVLDVGGLRERLRGPRFRSVAVLPFVNQSGSPADDAFAAGLHEGILTGLARLGSVKVTSRTSVTRYQATMKPAPAIAQELGVEALVEGTCLRVGDNLQITARLIDGRRDRLVWVGQYQRPVAGVLAVAGDVVRDIATGLRVDLTPEQAQRLAAPRPVEQRVLEPYLRGGSLALRFTPESVAAMFGAFDEAIRLDPAFAPALAARALAYSYVGKAGLMVPAGAFASAREDAERALSIDASLDEAEAALGLCHLYLEWDWDAAGRELRQALAFNPNNAWLYVLYSDYLLTAGRVDDALDQARRGRELDPLSAVARTAVGDALGAAGRHDEAVEECRQALELEPGAITARSCVEDNLFWSGQREAALRLVMDRLKGRPLAELIAAALRTSGPEGALRAMGDYFAAVGASAGRIEPFNMARFYAGAGDHDRAFAWLERAFGERAPLLLQLRYTADFNAMRSDARYQDLVRRIGFPSVPAGPAPR